MKLNFTFLSKSRLINIIIVLVSLQCFTQNKEKPNIIYINIDDLGWTDLTCYGSLYYETPNIDRLAKMGIKFTNAYASAANCAPSRASLLSGQYSPRHGIYTVGTSERGNTKNRKLIPIQNTKTLHDSIVTIAESLKRSNYITASVGKWHLGDDPKTQGFDINIGGTHAGHPKTYFSPYKNKNLKDGPKGEYLTDRLTDEAISFLNKNKSNPFFLYMTYYSVHTPIQGKEELIKKYKRKKSSLEHKNATYAAMIEAMDTNIGRLINTIEKLNLIEQTIIILTSDNGGLYTVSKQYPLKHGKGSYYEGGIRVPLIMRWDGKIKPQNISNIPVSNIDFYPTILDITKTARNRNQILDGKSLAPILFNKGSFKKRPLFWHFPIYLEASRGYNKETGRDPYFRTRPGSVIRYGNWKLHQYFENGDIELYNLKKDISEQHNLVNSKQKKVNELLDLLNNWRKQTNAPIPKQSNTKYQPSK